MNSYNAFQYVMQFPLIKMQHYRLIVGKLQNTLQITEVLMALLLLYSNSDRVLMKLIIVIQLLPHLQGFNNSLTSVFKSFVLISKPWMITAISTV